MSRFKPFKKFVIVQDGPGDVLKNEHTYPAFKSLNRLAIPDGRT